LLSAGVTHVNLTPATILLSGREMNPVLTDFTGALDGTLSEDGMEHDWLVRMLAGLLSAALVAWYEFACSLAAGRTLSPPLF
jgi:hypothetical protein